MKQTQLVKPESQSKLLKFAGRQVISNEQQSQWDIETRKNCQAARVILDDKNRVIFCNLLARDLFGNILNETFFCIWRKKNDIAEIKIDMQRKFLLNKLCSILDIEKNK